MPGHDSSKWARDVQGDTGVCEINVAEPHIDWVATLLENLPEDPGTSGHPEICGLSGGAQILGQVSQKGSSPINRKPGDVYFADVGRSLN